MDQQQQEESCCVPPGFRFHPTEEELVGYYLARKVASQKIHLDIIQEVDLYRIEPWDLQERCKYGGGEEQPTEWYFFSFKDRKYPSGTRTNRATAAGFWKATGRDKPVLSSSSSRSPSSRVIGMRKTLVFYRGRAPNGCKSEWIMHEYRLADAGRAAAAGAKKGSLRLDDWVLCRLYNKKNEWEKMQLGESTKEAKEEATSDMVTSQSHSHSWGEARTPESEIVDNDPFPHAQAQARQMVPKEEAMDEANANANFNAGARNDLFVDLSYDDIQSMYSGLDMLPPGDDLLYSSLFASPRLKGNQTGAGAGGLAPF